jgi:hypothetical protein
MKHALSFFLICVHRRGNQIIAGISFHSVLSLQQMEEREEEEEEKEKEKNTPNELIKNFIKKKERMSCFLLLARCTGDDDDEQRQQQRQSAIMSEVSIF